MTPLRNPHDTGARTVQEPAPDVAHRDGGPDDGPGRMMIPGTASGTILHSDVALCFWMGVDPVTGRVIGRHHPLCGEDVADKVLVLPGGRGSCAGNCGLVELIMGGHAPATLVFQSDEPTLTLGALLADEVFGRSIPVVIVGASWLRRLSSSGTLSIEHDRLEHSAGARAG